MNRLLEVNTHYDSIHIENHSNRFFNPKPTPLTYYLESLGIEFDYTVGFERITGKDSLKILADSGVEIKGIENYLSPPRLNQQAA